MNVFSLICVMLTTCLFGQSNWCVVHRYPVNTESIWRADLMGNLYISDKDQLEKFDTSNVKQYTQSIKSVGRITSILPINTMRIMLFSEEQQTFKILDNTLSAANQSYDLSEMGFGYVSQLAVSSQQNKLWVYDQLNSKLVLLDLGRSSQQQEIENLRGLLNSTEITWMKEEENKLFLFDGKQRVYVLDVYGSLLESIDIPLANRVEALKNELFVLKNKAVYRYRKEDMQMEKLDLPETEILEFQWVNYNFFVRTKNEITKYQFNL